jgi:hypothetical protein
MVYTNFLCNEPLLRTITKFEFHIAYLYFIHVIARYLTKLKFAQYALVQIPSKKVPGNPVGGFRGEHY